MRKVANVFAVNNCAGSRDSSVGLVTKLRAGRSKCRSSIPAREKIFNVHTGSWAHSASYTLGTGGKAVGA
jgi:hypothetical protein